MQDDDVEVWATDEVHFQQHGSRCRMWRPPEIRDPVLLHAPTRKSVGYFGAVRLRDGRFVFRLETGKFNGPSFLQFLQQLHRASRGTGRRVVVITDNAPLSPFPTSQTLARQARPPFRLGLPAAL